MAERLYQPMERPIMFIRIPELAVPWLYIAGPYTHTDVAVNVKTAISEADRILEDAQKETRLEVPVIIEIPHLTHFWHMMHPHEYRFWLDYDIHKMAHCDALYRFPGSSHGADGELVKMADWGKPVFFEQRKVISWIISWWKEHNVHV